jgi:hypothetical protein
MPQTGLADGSNLELQYLQRPLMSDIHKIAEITVITESKQPLTGILQVDTGNTVMKFEITEEFAHKICSDLERFLTW